jgi:hypothetical protein
MAMTTYEKGQLEGQRLLLRRLLEKRFGPLSAKASGRLAAMTADRLLQLSDALLSAKSLKELGLVE